MTGLARVLPLHVVHLGTLAIVLAFGLLACGSTLDSLGSDGGSGGGAGTSAAADSGTVSANGGSATTGGDTTANGEGGGTAGAGGKAFPPKFAGNITTNGAVRSDFKTYWNQITPENEGKWGSVQPSPGTWNWGPLDAIYKYASDNDIIFKEHNFVWGTQQPSWVNVGNAQTAVRTWMQTFCQR